MDFNPMSILFSLVFGVVGLSYFRHGKANTSGVTMASGVGLMGYPLFIHGPWYVLLVGMLLSLVPWLAGRLGIEW